jgi:DNA primase
VGGNVFTFLMELEKVSFVEAVRTLAERAGILLPAEGSEDRAQATENEGLYNACRVAGLHFHENLSTVEGRLALEYLRHRGFTEETIRKFGLGYSMNGWDDLIRFSEAKGITIDVLEKAGLAIRRDDGSGAYDRFRGRAMFPIFSPSGRAIAFGARKMREDDPVQGKYINSPETPVYVKSRSLYGLFQAREAIREKEFAILVEGYADLISVFQAGIENIVASSGTALTDEQIQLVARYARTIILVYDADSAGSKAALRGVDLLLENGLDVRVAALPDGEDPDSFVRKFGGKEFQKLVDGAVSFLEFKARAFQAEGLLASPEGQTRAVRSIVESIAKMKDELRRNVYIKTVAERYGIYESVLFRELEKILGHERSRSLPDRRGEGGGITPPAGTPVPLSLAELPAVQRDLLKLMLEHGPEMVRFVFTHITPDRFADGMARDIVDILRVRSDQEGDWDVSMLLDQLDDEGLKRSIADMVFSKYELSKGWEAMGAPSEEPDPWKMAEQCLLLFRRKELDDLIAENQHRMREASTRGEPAKPYLEQHQALLAEKKELENRSQPNRIP